MDNSVPKGKHTRFPASLKACQWLNVTAGFRGSCPPGNLSPLLSTRTCVERIKEEAVLFLGEVTYVWSGFTRLWDELWTWPGPRQPQKKPLSAWSYVLKPLIFTSILQQSRETKGCL